MLSSATPSSSSTLLLSILAIITASTVQLTEAKPYPRELFSSPQNATLEIRQCANPCGYVGLCCAATQQCYTDSLTQAQCGSTPATAAPVAATAGGSGSWQLFTTTYVETDLVTVVTTFSSFIAATPTVQTFAVTTTPASSNPICNSALNEVSCGPICCAQGQFCQFSGQCAAFGGSSPGAGTPGIVPITPTSSASATGFVRPTSNTVLTITSTGTATTTVPFQTPIASDGSAVTGMTVSTNNGLSGGAIAGIVIGVLLGIALLVLFCVLCCAKAVVDFFLGLFGLRNRSRRRVTTETEVFEERRHSSHGAGASRPVATRRTWYGATRPVTTVTQPKKSSGGGGGFLGIVALLAALWACLGLKRRREERKSEYGTGSYYSDDYTSASSESSFDRRTRQTRRSGR